MTNAFIPIYFYGLSLPIVYILYKVGKIVGVSMPSRPVSYRQVKLVADRVAKTGEIPSTERLYELLHEVASKELIDKHLEKWKAENILNEKGFNDSLEQLIEERTKELKESLSLVRATLESTADGIFIISKAGKLVDWNKKFVEYTGVPDQVLESGSESEGLQFIMQQLADPEGLIGLMQYLNQHPEIEGDMGDMHFRDGRIFERYSQPQLLDGEIVGRVWSFRDVTEKRKAESDLRLRKRAIDASTQGIIIISDENENEIVYVNPAFCKLLGISSEKATGKNLNSVLKGTEDSPELMAINLALSEKREDHITMRIPHGNGIQLWIEMYISPVKNENDEVGHFVIVLNDITERKAMEEQLLHLATHDALTGLPNRALVLDRIRQSMAMSSRTKSLVGLLFLDLDRFKNINDGLGHKMGDALLCLVAQRVKATIRSSDTVARIGGDEFIIVLPAVKNEEECGRIAQTILNEIRKPFKIEDRDLHITSSIGIAQSPSDGIDPDIIIRNADTAMYEAKAAGRDNFKYYTREMNLLVSQRLQLENDLRLALDRNEFEVFYQPISSLKDDKVVAVESLLRWHHPEKGFVPPSEFIPLAEDVGLILPIGEWVLEQACEQNKKWLNMGLPPIQITVNVSGRQLNQIDLCALVKNTLRKTNLDPNLLVLEITESVLMEYSGSNVVEKLLELKKLGVKLAIDDFGTGYSSLSYLKCLPVDKIKVDKTFVGDLSEVQDDASITLAIISLAKSLGMRVVAEGVETFAVLEFLRQNDCDEIQGYFFCRPINAEQCEKFIRENI